MYYTLGDESYSTITNKIIRSTDYGFYAVSEPNVLITDGFIDLFYNLHMYGRYQFIFGHGVAKTESFLKGIDLDFNDTKLEITMKDVGLHSMVSLFSDKNLEYKNMKFVMGTKEAFELSGYFKEFMDYNYIHTLDNIAPEFYEVFFIRNYELLFCGEWYDR